MLMVLCSGLRSPPARAGRLVTARYPSPSKIIAYGVTPLLLWRRGGGCRPVDRLIVGAGGCAEVAAGIFPDAEQQEGNDGGSGPEFGVARHSGFRLPAKQLLAHEESNCCANGQRQHLDADVDGCGPAGQDAFES